MCHGVGKDNRLWGYIIFGVGDKVRLKDSILELQ